MAAVAIGAVDIVAGPGMGMYKTFLFEMISEECCLKNYE